MTQVNRKIHVIGINSYIFGDLPSKLQDLFLKTRNIAVPNSYFEEIKLWSENDLFFSKPFSLHDLISSKYEFGTAIFAVSRNRFCDLKDRSSNLKELIPTT